MQGVKDLIFFLKVEVDGAGTVFDFLGNIANAGLVVTLLQENASRCIEYQLAHFFLFPLFSVCYRHILISGTNLLNSVHLSKYFLANIIFREKNSLFEFLCNGNKNGMIRAFSICKKPCFTYN